MHRCLVDLGGQHVPEQGSERHREVAVAAIQFQQVAAEAGRPGAGPAEHPPVDAAVGLGKAAFDLLVGEPPPVHLEFFQQPVAIEHDLLAAAASDHLYLQVRGQFACRRFPGRAKAPMVDQRDHLFAAQRGQKIYLEQPAAEDRGGQQALAQTRHQRADRCGRHREKLDHDRLLRVLRIEHRIVQLLALVPDAELGAQAVVLGGRLKDLGLGNGERRKGAPELRNLLRELRCVAGGIDTG